MAAEVKQDILYNLICNVGAFAEGMDRAIHGIDDLDKGMQKVEKNTSFLNQTLSTFVANIGVKVVGAIQQAVGKLGQMFNQFSEFAKSATFDAAKIEVQWRTLSLTAGNAGERIEDMTKHVQALRAAGIKTSEAIKIMTQFLANELPVENITELARRAQDMAVVIGTDSTEAFRRFNYFLQTGNSEWIRTMGITKTANQMLTEYAQTQGKVVKALSDRERKEALVQGLMKETLRYEGAYEEALKDPYKRWTSLPRLISNVTEVLGAVFVPMMGTVVDVFSDALEKIERLFRVTKKEAKETGATIGEWKEGFLRLRAVVTAFANWFMSIWNRVTGGFNEAAEGMMDRFVNAIVQGVRAAADALRRFAQFVAGIFGGRAPGEITAEAISAVTVEPTPAAPQREAPPAGAPIEIMADPARAAELREEPVEPVSAEDLQQMSILTAAWAEATEQLAAASAAAAQARAAMAAAEEWLEEASENVYNIRRRIQELEIAWAEVPERFIRGRKRQLQMELMAAEQEEHERQQVVEAERERLQLAEEYERQAQQTADSIQRQIDRLADSIAQQAQAYEEYLNRLQEVEAEAVPLEEPIQAIVNEFESLDDLTAGYLEEIESELLPAFASIEESVKSIVGSLGAAWDKVKGIAVDVWDFLGRVSSWFDGLPDWAKTLLKTGMLAIALNWVTGGAAGQLLKTALAAIFAAAGLIPSGAVLPLIGTAIAVGIALTPLFDEEVRQKWKNVIQELIVGNIAEAVRLAGEAFTTYIENLPFGLGGLWQTQQEMMGIASPEETASIWGGWIDRITDIFSQKKPEMEQAATEAIEEPIVEAMDRADRRILRESILPEMIAGIVAGLNQLATDVVSPLDRFAQAGIDAFQRVADGGLDLADVLDTLIGRVDVLDAAMRGFAPPPQAMALMADGSFKVITVNLQGSTFGGDLTASQVQDWIWEAINQVSRD